MKKIILTGYMGSGKTTVASLLAEKTGLKHLDLDEIVEKKAQFTIGEIFKNKGEIYFRKLEHECLKEAIASEENWVLSLGGGTPCYYNNHELLKENGVITFYLKASVATLVFKIKRKQIK